MRMDMREDETSGAELLEDDDDVRRKGILEQDTGFSPS